MVVTQDSVSRCRHTHLHDEEPTSSADVTSAQAAEMVRRATRSARTVAAIALLLALISSAGTCALLYQMETTGHLRGAPHDLISLSANSTNVATAASPVDAAEPDMPCYYRVVLNTIVREGSHLDSDRVGVLTVGDRVFAVEKQGRRVRIEHPVYGWVSSMTRDGIDIIQPDAAMRGVRTGPNASLLEQVGRDPEAKAALAAIQQQAAAFAGFEQKLIDAMRQVNDVVIKEGGKGVAQVLQTKELRGAGKVIAGEAVKFSKRAAGSFQPQVQAAGHLLQERLPSGAREKLLEAGRPLGEQAAKLARAWSKALGQ